MRIPENDGYTHTPAHTNVIGYELLFVAQYYFPLIFLSQPYQDFLLLLGGECRTDVMQFERVLLIPIGNLTNRSENNRKQYDKPYRFRFYRFTLNLCHQKAKQ